MDSASNLTYRINPIPQQSGAQTIQQAIYQSHKSPCGYNTIVFDPIGITEIRFVDLKTILDEALNSELSVTEWNKLRDIGTTYLLSPTRFNKLAYVNQLGYWAQIIFASIPNVVISGYKYHLNVSDTNGFTIWDSQTPELYTTALNPILGYLDYTQIPLIQPNPYTEQTINLYGIVHNPGYFAYIDKTDPIGLETLQSAFLISQTTLPETMMAVASLLTDPANTRTFGFKYYGFSARQQVPNYIKNDDYGDLGYYCSYLSQLYTIKTDNWDKHSLIENVIIRLGLEQAPLNVVEEPTLVPSIYR
jgi:hypothetical protein